MDLFPREREERQMLSYYPLIFPFLFFLLNTLVVLPSFADLKLSDKKKEDHHVLAHSDIGVMGTRRRIPFTTG